MTQLVRGSSTVKVWDVPIPGLEFVRITNCQTADTYVASKIGRIEGFAITDETTTGGAKATFTGHTLTITCTNDDEINLIIWGAP